MQRDSVGIRGLKPWGSPYAMKQGPGYQVNWAKVSDFWKTGKWNIQLNGAAAIGADSLTVDPTTRDIKRGDRIDLGDVQTVLVTFSAALINATSVGVTALPGPLPSGAILKTADSQEFVKLTAPAAAGATTITTEALPNALEGGETATYEGGANVVEATEDVATGATSIPITNLNFAVADNAKGYLQKSGFSDGDKWIPEATVMALDTTTTPYTMFPRRDATTEQAFAFAASDMSNSNRSSSDSKSGYGTVVGNTYIYENLCPDSDDNGGDLPSAYKTELIANAHFKANDFVDYVDTRA